jgi:hypothetical protein
MWLLTLACLIVLVAACFHSVLFAGGQFGYRDAAYYYYPLYLRVQQEWAAGRIPLWEPEENGGIPLIGNPTAAVLYPGKVIYAFLPYAWGARIYVIAHVLLAFGAMVVFARSLGTSTAGAVLAGLSYAFGAPVLFQYANIIYLVGAAWMPLGLHAVDRIVRRGERWGVPELAVVLAMQVLGGDPQAAYLTLLCGGGYALGLARVRAAGSPRRVVLLRAVVAAVVWWSILVLLAAGKYRSLPSVGEGLPSWIPSAGSVWAVCLVCAAAGALWAGRRRDDVRRLRPMLVALGGSSILGLALTAVQLLPTIEYSRQSFRALDRSPVEIYPFSLEVYRLIELAWPGVYGSAFPENRHWLPTIEPLRNHEFWSPSLYVGGLTLVLAWAGAMGRVRTRTHQARAEGPPSAQPQCVWLIVITLLSLLAGLGRHSSPLWLARFVPPFQKYLGPHDPPFTGPFRADGFPQDGDGGVYWLMATALPGFGTFRYPSKLLTLTVLAISALAGLGWDRVLARQSRTAFGVGLGLLVAGVLALGATFLGEPTLLSVWTRRGLLTASQLGPFDPLGALGDLRRSLLHGSAVMAVAVWLALAGSRRPRLAVGVGLLVATADLAVANARLIWTIPQNDFERVPTAVRIIAEAERADPSPGPFRVHRMPYWRPYDWPRHASPGRLREIFTWERDTLQPLYALPERINYTMTKGALELYDYLWFFRPLKVPAEGRTAELLGVAPGEPVLYQPRRGFDLWGTRYYILPVRSDGWMDEGRAYAAFLSGIEMIYPRLEDFEGPGGPERKARWRDEQDWHIFKSKTAYPRAWVVHDARFVKPITGLDPADRDRPMRMLLFQNDAFWHSPDLPVLDTRQAALVEADRRALTGFLPGPPTGPSETVEVVLDSPQRVELEANLERPGLVVLADVYYPGWRLSIDGTEVPVLRVNRMMRGAAVRAGQHRLIYVYDPPSFRIGAYVSLAALAVLSGLIHRATRPDVAGKDEAVHSM